MQKAIFNIYFINRFLCGGGGSSSPIDSSPNNDSNNNSNSISETCEQQQTNLLRCDFKHQGLDRYYLIQPSHPEAEGQSFLILNLHGCGSNALEQMHYTGLNNYTNSKENNFILIHLKGLHSIQLLLQVPRIGTLVLGQLGVL